MFLIKGKSELRILIKTALRFLLLIKIPQLRCFWIKVCAIYFQSCLVVYCSSAALLFLEASYFSKQVLAKAWALAQKRKSKQPAKQRTNKRASISNSQSSWGTINQQSILELIFKIAEQLRNNKPTINLKLIFEIAEQLRNIN